MWLTPRAPANPQRCSSSLMAERTPSRFSRAPSNTHLLRNYITNFMLWIGLKLITYRHKQKEHDGLSSRGDSLDILKQEVKGQSKHVKNMQKRSLWPKKLEEVGRTMASVGLESGQIQGQMDTTRIETLHHAEKGKADALTGACRVASSSYMQIKKWPWRSKNVKYRKFVPGISKSQEFDTKSSYNKQSRMSKSNSHSPASANRKDILPVTRSSMLRVIDFEINRTKALDLIDRLDDLNI